MSSSSSSRPLRPCVYVPVPTFFFPGSEDIDIPTFEAHIARLCRAGLAPLVAGTAGEAVHLSHSERVELIRAARNVLDRAEHANVPVIAGTGAGSTRETIELCKEAAQAGADYAIVIASGYFSSSLMGNKKALMAFWSDVASQSPIPIIIYNYPGASGGIDLDADLIVDLAESCPNICGVKLTYVSSTASSASADYGPLSCGNVGKLTRITSSLPRIRREQDNPFLVLGGYADILLSSTFVNSHGSIAGLANIAPFCVTMLFQMAQGARTHLDHLPDAQRLQGTVARAEYAIFSSNGITNVKFLLERVHGYGGVPRRPLLPIEADAAEALWLDPDVQELIHEESSLAAINS